MAVYVSRYLSRRQTIIAGKIKNIERYDRYYDIAYDALKNRTFPRVTLPAGRLVVRTMKGPYDARGIPPHSSTNTSNRFNGVRPDGRPGHGALYVGTLAGVLREYTHYSVPPGSTPSPAVVPPHAQDPAGPIWTPGGVDNTAKFMQEQRGGKKPADKASKFYLFRVNQPLHFADVRITALAPLMTQLRLSATQRYGISSGAEVDFLTMAASAANDYSASRGIADAVYDLHHVTGIKGLCAFSARPDSDSGMIRSSEGDPTGGLIFVIFGADSSVVTALTPVPNHHFKVAFDTFAELSARVEPRMRI